MSLREYTLSLNEFNRPKVLENQDATCLKLAQLILLEKGIFLTRPDAGVGIVSRYRYASSDDMEQLKVDIDDQVSTYLPELIAAEVEVSYSNKTIKIAIVVNDIVYSLIFDQETVSLNAL